MSLTPFLPQVCPVALAAIHRKAGERENSSWSPYTVLPGPGLFQHLSWTELTSTAVEKLTRKLGIKSLRYF